MIEADLMEGRILSFSRQSMTHTRTLKKCGNTLFLGYVCVVDSSLMGRRGSIVVIFTFLGYVCVAGCLELERIRCHRMGSLVEEGSVGDRGRQARAGAYGLGLLWTNDCDISTVRLLLLLPLQI